MTSNKHLPNGEDKIIFFDKNSKKIIDYIKFENSFTISENNLSLIEIPESRQKKRIQIIIMCLHKI